MIWNGFFQLLLEFKMLMRAWFRIEIKDLVDEGSDLEARFRNQSGSAQPEVNQ